MKITVSNLKAEYPKIKINLPEALGNDKYDKMVNSFMPHYNKSEVITKTIDTFVAKLNEAIGKQPTPIVKVAPTPKKVLTKAPKKVKTVKKVTKKVKTTTEKKCNDTKQVESLPEDIRLIRRFYSCIGKERSGRTLITIYRDFERRKTERKVNANSAQAELINEIGNRLKKVIDNMSIEKLSHVQIVVDKNNQEFVTKVEMAAKSLEIRATVNLLKRFIGIEGEKADKAKVKLIHTAFENAIKKGKICANDMYWNEFQASKTEMEKYLKGDISKISITPQQLNGLRKVCGLAKIKPIIKKKKSNRLKGIVGNDLNKIKKLFSDSSINRLQCEPLFDLLGAKLNKVSENRKLSGIETKTNLNRIEVELPKPVINTPEKANVLNGLFEPEKPKNSLFTPITESSPKSTIDKITLPGDLGKFLGYVERYQYSILLRGEKGAGKTRLAYQLMNTFALANFSVGCFSLEIGKDSNLVTDMRNTYLHPTIASKVQIAEACPNGLKDIEEAAKLFDCVVIDSWGKIPNIKSEDFDHLRKTYPKTMFIVIFQSTTNGTARGGSMPEYDAGIVIQVAKGGRAICEKNRYNGNDLVYLVFDRKLEDNSLIEMV